VPGDSLPTAPRDRILSHSGVRSVYPHRDSVVGVVLDQRGIVAGSRVHRPAQRADDRHPEFRHQPDLAAGLLYQGNS